MNYSQLNRSVRSIIAAVGFSLLVVACNNNDDSANNSTSGDKSKDSNSDKMAPSNTAVAKKKGKASSRMTAEDVSVKMEKDKMGYYNRTEVAPQFAGGQSDLDAYINDNIEYPQDAIDNNIEGTVNVQFAVDEKGNVSNISTVGNKLGYGLEEEAIKVISRMPKWSPGQVKGKSVKTWRMLPINYQLES
jgi:TonB family protein